MNLYEAKQILNDEGYELIDEGLGNIIKKARRSIFGKNKEDKEILAKRKTRTADQAKKHAEDENQHKATLTASEKSTTRILKYLQKNNEYSQIYEILVKLNKKYGKYISYSNDLTPNRISIYAIYKYTYTNKEFSGKYSDRDGGKYTSAPVNRNNYNFCKVGEIGLLATDRFNYEDRAGRDGDSNAHMKYATSVQNAMNKKYTETDDIQEWAVEISDLVKEIVNAK